MTGLGCRRDPTNLEGCEMKRIWIELLAWARRRACEWIYADTSTSTRYRKAGGRADW